MAPGATDHLTLWDLGPQQLCLDFTAGRVVSDAGLLAVRALERPLRVIADLAPLLPDPRSPDFELLSGGALLSGAALPSGRALGRAVRVGEFGDIR